MKSWMTYLSILMFLILSGCNDFLFFGNSSSSSSLADMDLEDIAVAIDEEVGNAEADHISQCDIKPIGAKPCGGPWGYLVYSKKVSSESTLDNLIERYNKLDEIRNVEEGLASTCDVAQPPDLTLKNGTCFGDGHYAWNPGDILVINGIEN